MADSNAADLVLEYIESVWNGADTEALARLTAPGFTYHLGGQPGRDRPAMAAFIRLIHGAFPDWRVEVAAVVAQGGDVAVRWTGSVTHGGDFRGIPATGKRIQVSGINMYRVEEGRIAEEWEQMDSVGMLQQMGVTG
jgi:steroid delta-isomerase-like uncharacterized protein